MVDTNIEDTINVIFSGKVLKFCPCGAGLYYLDVQNMNNHCYQLNDNIEEFNIYSLVQSVASNKDFLSKNELADADRELYYQELLGWPSMNVFWEYIKRI